MRASTAAGPLGAAMLSTLIYPFVGLALRRRSVEASGTGPPGTPSEATAPA